LGSVPKFKNGGAGISLAPPPLMSYNSGTMMEQTTKFPEQTKTNEEQLRAPGFMVRVHDPYLYILDLEKKQRVLQ